MEIDYIRPKIIIAAGNVAMNVFIDKPPGITKCRGTPFNYMLNDESYLVVPLYHPSYIKRAESYKEKFITVDGEFISDLEYIRDILYDNLKEDYIYE